MKTMLEYKGYLGKVEFDAEAGVLYGEVIGIRDVVTFQGKSVAEVEQAFHESVDDYLDFCRTRGENPDKPYSGKFILRISPKLHREVAIFAKAQGLSVDQWVAKCLNRGLRQTAASMPFKPIRKKHLVKSVVAKTRHAR